MSSITALSAKVQGDTGRYIPLPKETTISKGESTVAMDFEDIIDAKKVRSYFPALAGGPALFNNASGTVVLKDAVERYVFRNIDSMPCASEQGKD